MNIEYKQNLFVVLLHLCLVLSCTHREKIGCDNVEIVDIGEYADKKLWNPTYYEYDARVVKLETTTECLISHIENLFFSDKYIYVKTSTPQIFIFDYDGNYINKLKLGNGKGEITQIIDACYDNEKNELLVYQDPFVKFYTPTGVYKYEKEIQYFFVKIASVKHGYILKSPIGYMRYKSKPNTTLIFVDKNFENPHAYLNCANNKSINSNMSLCYDVTNDVVVIPSNADTIYYLIDGVLIPKYYTKYPKNNIVGPDLFVLAENYLETSEFQYFSFINKGVLNVFRDKKTGNIIAGRFEDAEKAAFVTSPIAIYKDYFVCVKNNPNSELFYKSELLSTSDLDKINSQKEDDNPLLIFFKLKPLCKN